MTNAEIAHTLEKLAFFLSLQGENEFKINAYRRAARSIVKHPLPLEEMILAGGELTSVPGVGKIIAKKIEDLLIIGEKKFLIPYRQSYPECLFELTCIKGIGPKTIAKIYRDHLIGNLAELREFLSNGRKLGVSAAFSERIQRFFSE